MKSTFVCRRVPALSETMSNYLNHAQREEIETLRSSLTGRTEWPTWLLLIGVYGAWFGVLLASPWLGLWLSTALLIPIVVLWMAVQHELLHGHPTRFIWLNKTVFGRLLLGAPLALSGSLLMLGFIARYSLVPVWRYLLLISVSALSVAMIRSYYEHRPHAQAEQRREQWLKRSGGFLVQGYGELFRRHGLTAVDSPAHPFS
jgi:hypothetical protein